MKDLGQYLEWEDEERESKASGVPTDSLDNQLNDWIRFGKQASKAKGRAQRSKADAANQDFEWEPLRFAIKADAEASYHDVEKVIDCFRDNNEFRFHMITNLEGGE